MSRPGLLRQRSSYGPPLDFSHTFNDADPKVNAMRNSLSRPVTPLAVREPRKIAASDPIPATSEPRRKRQVSFSSPESPPLSPSQQTSTEPSPCEPSPALPKHSYPDHDVVPRHASDPGPTSGAGWLYQSAKPRKRSQSVTGPLTHGSRPIVSPSNGTNYIKNAIQMIAELVPRERQGLHTIESPQDKIRAEIDEDLLLRRILETPEEVAEYLPYELAQCTSGTCMPPQC